MKKDWISLILTFFITNTAYTELKYSLNQLQGQERILDLSGSAGFYYRDLSNRESGQARQEFGNSQFWLNANTYEWHGFSAGISIVHNGEFADEENGYNENISNRKLSFAEAYVSYTYSKTNLTLGRRVKGPDSGNWIMLDDFYEGVFFESRDIDGLTTRVAWVRKSAVFDPDEVTDFEKFNGSNDSDGVYGAEITWDYIDNLDISLLYYRANGAYSLYGGRIQYKHEWEELQYNQFKVESFHTHENGGHGLGQSVTQGDDRGSIFHVNNTFRYKFWDFGAGYIKADRKLGSASLINNPWDPFEEDDFHTQLPNAGTWYLTAGVYIDQKFSFNLVYGESRADTGDSESATYRQFNALAVWNINEQASIEAGYVHIDTSDGVEEGFDKYFINTVITF